VPRKPLDQLSPAYRKRIENAMKKGKTLQQARGHRAQEHVHRKRREEAATGLSNAQDRAVFLWAVKRNHWVSGRVRNDEEFIDPQEIVDWKIENGYDAFKEYRNTWEAERKAYIRRGYSINKDIGALQMGADTLGIEDVSWLYYH
jgi:hypothetical protein